MYFDIVLKSMRRLLSLMDRNPTSLTYGCFDRNYWLHRKTDFATSTAQMSMRTLALLYKNNFLNNEYYQNSNVLNWILAAMEYTMALQHSDGSFDEWYPNERGWGGPTGYVLNSIAETYILIQNDIKFYQNDNFKNKVYSVLQKSVDHLSKRDEHDVLTNHYAITAAAIFNANRILSSESNKIILNQTLKKMAQFFCQEGWGMEYDGCDLAYNLGTINFLTEIYAIEENIEIQNIVKESFKYLIYFMNPNGEWVSNLSSRHTLHNYFFALEFWSKMFPEANTLLNKSQQSLNLNLDLLPSDQEDHYLHYRLTDYVKAGLFSGGVKDSSKLNCLLPFELDSFKEKYFPYSGHLIKRQQDHIIWIATKRGGALTIYNLKKEKSVFIHNGFTLQSKNKKNYTSLWQSSVKINTENMIIEGTAEKFFNKPFNLLTFLIFRMTVAFLKNSISAYYFKIFIRKVLITPKRKSIYKYKREFIFEQNKLIIHDDFINLKDISYIFYGGSFYTRYVPQAHYFFKSELDFKIHKIKNSRQNRNLSMEFDFTTDEHKLCAE
jgi:hypothetical protein